MPTAGPSTQLKLHGPCSSRHKGWDSTGQTQTSSIGSSAVKHLSWPLAGTTEKFMCSPRVYLPFHADVSDTLTCLDNLLQLTLLEQRDWTR